MPQFYYRNRREMTVRAHDGLSTVYLQQTPDQRARTLEWLQTRTEHMVEVFDRNADLRDWAGQPLRGFRRTRGQPNYSVMDIVTDLLGQMVEGRDMTESMLNRWNRLFHDTEWEIEMCQAWTQSEPRPDLAALFEA